MQVGATIRAIHSHLWPTLCVMDVFYKGHDVLVGLFADIVYIIAIKR